jgi:hypothetical protein
MRALTHFVGLHGAPCTARQFAAFRIVLGVYLAVHLVMLVPYGPELFGASGVVPDPSLQPTYPVFPNLLAVVDSPEATQAFLAALTALALALACGWRRPWVAVLLWYGWACLFNRNNFIGNPGLPSVGWLLLACAVVPPGEPYAWGAPERPNWRMPVVLVWGAWGIMALGYTLSGVHKLGAPSWADGTAIHHLLGNPLARHTPLRIWLLASPPWATTAMSYSALALEVLFLPLAICRWTRPMAWGAMVLMHLGIVTLISFADLTAGVLMLHLFTFDAAWLRLAPSHDSPHQSPALGRLSPLLPAVAREGAPLLYLRGWRKRARLDPP